VVKGFNGLALCLSGYFVALSSGEMGVWAIRALIFISAGLVLSGAILSCLVLWHGKSQIKN